MTPAARKLTDAQRRTLERVAGHQSKRGKLCLLGGRMALCVPALRDRGLLSVEEYSAAFARNNYRVVLTDAGREALAETGAS